MAAGCVPHSHENVGEVGDAVATANVPPVFPQTGEVPPDLLVEGLVYDFTNADVDLDLWVPPTSEAQCAAEKIVQNHGKRLSDLGFEPGRSGAGLNDIALIPAETRVHLRSVPQLCEHCRGDCVVVHGRGAHVLRGSTVHGERTG